ncbi:MAG: pseudouridine synthase [Trueperaceae bacterium]
MERLQKYLARAGIASRRKAEELIISGRVTVNGQRAILGSKANDMDEVRVDGKKVEKMANTVTYMLNKPTGVVTTAEDERGRKTVLELLPNVPGLHPVGRLDMDSEGLLLLTTDGDLTLRLTHPRYEHEKEYRVWCKEGEVQAGELSLLEKGLELDDGPARAVVAKRAEDGCKLVIAEGRNRQVRRMLAKVGYNVTRLVRTRVARLELGELPSGQYRQLSPHELKLLE